ncbi:MAG: hypothetical protein IT210_17890 [Armatimonadetes bacterium]|nr:hypothetical protein [Armatimonadota bacterium]
MSAVKAGFGKAIISPGLGVEMAGYFERRLSTAVHDDLFARAMVLDDGSARAAIVSCDLICLTAEEVARIRDEIEKVSPIAGPDVLVCATHTHTGPQTRLLQLPEEVSPTKEWLDAYPAKAARAVRDASESLEWYSIEAGQALEDRIAFNRRYRMKDGTVRTNPGIGNSDIVEPAGPIDPEVGILGFRGEDGRLKGVYVNYACHLDNVGGTEISADFPGYLDRRLQERVESRPFVLFTNGACGDINHIDVRSPYYRHSHEHSRWMGETLAGDACVALSQMEPLAGRPVAVAREVMRIPLREGATAEYQEAEIQAIRAGEIAFVGIPAEYFVELQLGIKKRSPFRKTFVSELANGWIGYIPTRRAFEENMAHVSWERMDGFDHMGYEVRSALSRGHSPGVGETMADKAVELLESLR